MSGFKEQIDYLYNDLSSAIGCYFRLYPEGGSAHE